MAYLPYFLVGIWSLITVGLACKSRCLFQLLFHMVRKELLQATVGYDNNKQKTVSIYYNITKHLKM